MLRALGGGGKNQGLHVLAMAPHTSFLVLLFVLSKIEDFEGRGEKKERRKNLSFS